MYNINDYYYLLPEHLIAQHPCDQPEKCKLLYFDNDTISDYQFENIKKFLDGNSVLFLNNTKVIKSRIPLENVIIKNPLSGEQKTIKKGEIFFLKYIDDKTFEALVYPGKKFKIGYEINIDNFKFTITNSTREGRIIETNCHNLEDFFEKHGQMPLPPYISYSKEKEQPYQPIFAQKSGSTASPTASLHFTKELLKEISDNGTKIEYGTLHVGLGTFKMVDVENIKEYDIHKEEVEFDTNIFEKIKQFVENGSKICAVGTTVTRSLESLPYLRKVNPIGKSEFRDKLTENISIEKSKEIIHNLKIEKDSIRFETKLFLYPGERFYIIDNLITNFHLPKSSLLMLVAAFVGFKETKEIYEYAIKNNYRFFSFGDAMFLKKLSRNLGDRDSE